MPPPKKRVRATDGDSQHGDNEENVADHTSQGNLLLPSSRSITHVLYPPSYLGIRSPSPDPPPYPVQGDNPDASSSITARDPLAEDPALTGVPSQGTPCSSISSVEPNPPTAGVVDDSEDSDTEQLPAYSRFDQRCPRFPVASDVLGPYPPLPVLRQAAR